MSDYAGEPGSVVEMIQRDHRVIRGLLDRLDLCARSERGAVFRDVVDYLVRHEVAEEQVVFPTLCLAAPSTEKILEECALEQSRTEARLAVMEAMDASSVEFWEQVAQLRDDVSAHSTHEEQVVLPLLQGESQIDLIELGRSYELARASAPSHPDPEPEGEAAPGVVATLFDRLRHPADRS